MKVYFDDQPAEIETRIKVGASWWRIFLFTEFIDRVTQAIKANPMITHCGDCNCRRCNDLVKGGPIFAED